MEAKNPHLKGLILDLRNNPGGLVDQAVDVAGDFLNGGEVVSQRGRDPRDITRYNAKADGDMLHGLPVVGADQRRIGLGVGRSSPAP